MNIWATIRLGLILAGLAGAAAFVIAGITAEVEDPNASTGDTVAKDSPIVLQTASPVSEEYLHLSKPLSLEARFGRSELTGVAAKSISNNPLAGLNFDRRWDISLVLDVPEQSADLPPDRANDEVIEPELEDIISDEADGLEDLPESIQNTANKASIMLVKANKLLSEGMKLSRGSTRQRAEGSLILKEADALFVEARDVLSEALMAEPNHPFLMSRMREIKAGLYSVRKHRID